MEREGRVERPEVVEMIMEKKQQKGSSSKRLTVWPYRVLPWALLGALLVLVLGLTGDLVAAEHALSEVWSESEGIQVKYSTDHDDLLSTKGSDLKLHNADQPSSTDAAKDEENPGTAAGESSSSPEAGTSEEADEKSSDSRGESESDGEQADSNKQSNRVHPNSSTGSSGPKQIAHYKSNPSTPVYAEQGEPSKKSSAIPTRDNDSSQSYNSALDQVEDSDEGGDKEDQTSVDHGDESAGRDESNSKFRQPGRQFKEAIKMSAPSSAKKADEANADEDDDNETESKSALADQAGEIADDADKQTNQEAERGAERNPTGGSGSGAGPRARHNMIDFDNMVDNKHNQGAFGQQQRNGYNQRAQFGGSFGGPEMGSLDPDEQAAVRNLIGDDAFRRTNQYGRANLGPTESSGDDDEDSMNFRGSMQANRLAGGSAFYDSAGRAMAAGSSAHPKTNNNNKHPAPSAKQAAYKQLSYFKSVKEATGSSERAPDSSPDSVRDNFISPGHYPGSMPHLNLAAASETQKKELVPNVELTKKPEEVSASEEKIAEPKPAGEPVYAAASNVEQTSQEEQRQQSAGNEEALKMVASDTSSSRVEPSEREVAGTPKSPEVTPEPEGQPDSQQIMAPILLSTTTMAPMSESSTSSITTSTSTTTSTTTQAPSLKRFKFRKYR